MLSIPRWLAITIIIVGGSILLIKAISKFRIKRKECMNKKIIEAAEEGDLVAQVILADMYYHGDKIEKNYEKALELYKLASEQGDEYAQMSVAYMYCNGEVLKWIVKKLFCGIKL